MLDELTDLPEGMGVELVPVEEDFDPEERARLLAAIDEASKTSSVATTWTASSLSRRCERNVKLRVGKRAQQQANKMEAWWVEHRPAAQSLVHPLSPESSA